MHDLVTVLGLKLWLQIIVVRYSCSLSHASDCFMLFHAAIALAVQEGKQSISFTKIKSYTG